jgi:membrane protein DedA with SNARE-associated domain
VATLIAHYGLPLVALIIFAGEIGVPTLVPGEVGLLIAGNQAIRSVPMLIVAIAIFGAIDLLATTTIHAASRTAGNRLLKAGLNRICRRKRSPEEMVGRWRKRLGGHDSAVVFVTRLIPMFRLYASIATGLIRVDVRRFLTGAAPAAWLWASIPLTIGFLLRSELGGLVSGYSTVMQFVIPVSIIMTLCTAVTMWHRRGALIEERTV